jgi:probable rRNA maturation factor
MNRNFLGHDYYTDIITFDNSEEKGILFAELYISLDRVKENAISLHVAFEIELFRVMAHGILHLCGYGDKTPDEIKTMREKENYYLDLLL